MEKKCTERVRLGDAAHEDPPIAKVVLKRGDQTPRSWFLLKIIPLNVVIQQNKNLWKRPVCLESTSLPLRERVWKRVNVFMNTFEFK